MNYEPRNEEINPPTLKSADGSTTLKRYRVDAVIYAPSSDIAKLRLDAAEIYLDAGRFVND